MVIKKIAYFVLSVFLCCACNTETPEEQNVENPELVKACHFIQGGAVNATGGQGGTVYVVTTLLDSIDPAENKPVPGTLRYAVEQAEARIVVFRVAGVIHLKKPLTITRGNLTIAGQSAPGDGICLADYPLIIKGADNVIVRFIRVRLGNASLAKDAETDYDAMSVNDSKNVVIDHCSFSWSVDECVSCYGNENFTMQYCFITESLRNAGHVKGAHGYGGIWGGKNASFHHNLLAHHDSRNPRFDHSYVNNTCFGPIDYVNNVVYNWGDNSTYGGEGYTKVRQINMVNNYYKYGPATGKSRKNRLVDPTVSCSYCSDGHTLIPGKFYLSGNYMYGDADVTADNWKGSTQNGSNVKATARWTSGLTALEHEQTAEQAYETVLNKAGCSHARDIVDTRIVREVREGSYTYSGSKGSKNGLIDTPSDVGGWPESKSTTGPTDTDYDGIPDEWEERYGLNPKSYGDSRKQTLVAGFTNLEVYLNHLVRNLYE